MTPFYLLPRVLGLGLSLADTKCVFRGKETCLFRGKETCLSLADTKSALHGLDGFATDRAVLRSRVCPKRMRQDCEVIQSMYEERV